MTHKSVFYFFPLYLLVFLPSIHAKETVEKAHFNPFTNGTIPDLLRSFKQQLPFALTYSGFVKVDTFWDTRQPATQDFADGTFVLFPDPKRPDVLGRDINNRGEYNTILLQTRLRYDVSGPDVCGAKTSAIIEGDFYGTGSAPTIHYLRLRHAFCTLTWPKWTILWGHYWHPCLVIECAPDLLPADAGVPIALESRTPQFRVKYNVYKNFDILITLATQFGYENNGPEGFTNIYVRNSMVPNVNLRMQVLKDKNIIGYAVDYKRLRPRLESNTGYKVNEVLSSTLATFFVAHQWNDNFLTKFCFNVGQNGTNFYLLSGYGVHSIAPVTDERTYTNQVSYGGWSEFIYTTKRWEPAIFFGATKNIGAIKTVIPEIVYPDGVTESLIYNLKPNLGTVIKISPRARFFFEPVTFGMEFQWTRAGYGRILPHSNVDPNRPVWSLRIISTLYYFF